PVVNIPNANVAFANAVNFIFIYSNLNVLDCYDYVIETSAFIIKCIEQTDINVRLNNFESLLMNI
ncbi:hypothetical protein ACSE35_06365, partial [Staphylococcus aureus]